MKMKKLIALFIFLVTCCLFLASCETGIGDYLEEYYKTYQPDPVYNVMYDFYIICEDDTAPMAKSTVNEKVNQLFGDKYNTTLNIFYLSKADYENQLKVDLDLETIEGYTKNDTKKKLDESNKSKPESDRIYYGGKIVLINNSSMLDYIGGELVDLKPYLVASTGFGTLNTQINKPLLDAADIDGKKLAIPNNRVYGEYEYICINRAIAENKLNISALTEIPAMTEDDVNELLTIYAKYLDPEHPDRDLTDDEINSIVRYEKGQYDLKAQIESGDAEGYAKDADNDWMCNVITYPTATTEIAYASAFGVIPEDNIIVKNKEGVDVVAVDYTYRAMQIIYSFNADKEMHNLLCYGVPNTNYTMVEDKVVPLKQQQSHYSINLIYCGDVFMSYYSDNWTKEMAASGANQLKESVPAK